MSVPSLFVRVDLTSGLRIGPDKIVLLEAIRSTGSISAAARSVGMSHRWAWLLVDEMNQGLQERAVTARPGGRRGGGAIVTAAGEHVAELYRAIEAQARSAVGQELHTLGLLGMRPKRS